MEKQTALLVKLTITKGKRAEFEAYERSAAAILSDYSGAITLAFQPDDEPGAEWHVVTFPDAAALAAYRQDERVAALKSQRDTLITSTYIRHYRE